MIRCSPIFGLGEINDFVDFKYSVENINKSILDNFWGQISTIYHYGENDDSNRRTMHRPFHFLLDSRTLLGFSKNINTK